MAITDEIKQLQKEGKTEQEITHALQSKGYLVAQISDALSQTKIKQAVSEPALQTQTTQPVQEQPQKQPIHPALPAQTSPIPPPAEEEKITSIQKKPMTKELKEMKPSLLSSEQEPKQEAPEAPRPTQTPTPQEQETQYPQEQYQYPQDQPQQYQDYYQYPSNLSSDTITEISEQVVSEKLSLIRDRLEKIIDLKNTFETQISQLDERLKRIEKIIDQLQLSVLQKIGEYASNINDIKHELIETQKSFKVLVPTSKRKGSKNLP